MSTIDEQFIDYIVKSLVSKPDAVQIDRSIDDKGVLLELTVDGEDLGRVIGKRGATAQSLRTLLRALGTKNEERYNLKIIDTADGEPLGRPTNPATANRQSRSEELAAETENISTEKEENTPAMPEKLEPALELPEPVEENNISDALSQTRKELAELDDLDV